METVFSRVQVLQAPNGAHTITWKIRPDFQVSAFTGFYVEYAREGDTWTRVNASSPATGDSYTDTRYLRHPVQLDYSYRVVLAADGTEQVSVPVSLFGDFSRREWLLMSRALRQQYFHFQNMSQGFSGHLLKRRDWGTPCSCTDPDTGAPNRARCTACYETGVLGGYYAPIPMWIYNLKPVGHDRGVRDPQGTDASQLMEAMAPAYPLIEPDDVFVDSATDIRYRITYAQENSLRRLPISYNLGLQKLPGNCVERLIPTTGTNPGWTDGISRFGS